MNRQLLGFCMAFLTAVPITSPVFATCFGGLGVGASLGGTRPFPDDNPWNRNVSRDPVDPNSQAIIARMGATSPLRAEFGSGLYAGARIGIPYVVVPEGQPPVPSNSPPMGTTAMQARILSHLTRRLKDLAPPVVIPIVTCLLCSGTVLSRMASATCTRCSVPIRTAHTPPMSVAGIPRAAPVST